MFSTKKFSMNRKDFGPFDVSVFQIGTSMEADGILGVDFLKNYAVFLDFNNNKMWIGPSSKVCGAIISQN